MVIVIFCAVPIMLLLAVAFVGGFVLAPGIVAAITVLLYWVAGIIGGLAVAAGAAWFLTRGHRARRDTALAALRERQRRDYERDREDRSVRRAEREALAQARAMGPYAALIAMALNNNPPPAESAAWAYSAEVIRRDNA